MKKFIKCAFKISTFKRYLLALSTTFCFCTLLSAKTITVSNNPNSPGQYTRLDSAILAASAGDVLLVSGSAYDYNFNGNNGGGILIDKPLVIYGQGYDPRNEQALTSTISVIHIAYGGSGSTISGFSIGSIYEDANTNSITISRCNIGTFGYPYDANHDGIYGNNQSFRENIIGGVIYINGNVGDILIQNNIITGSIATENATVTNFTITNNYFSNNSTINDPNAIYSLSNASVYNNIFYYKSASLLSVAYVGSSVTNCIFNNNIYYNTTSTNPFNIGVNYNSGSNNINANPDFVNIDLTSFGVTRLDNFNLLAGSPGIGKGTDSTNIGPEGGNTPIQYPYTGYPAIPIIDSMSIYNPVIPPNGTLKVKFVAHSNN